MKDAKNLSTEELEALLKEKKQEELKERNAKRAEYELKKKLLINSIGIEAIDLYNALKEAKGKFFEAIVAFRHELLEYGELKGGESNKGNFEIKNDDFKIQFSSAIKKEFDERAELAEAKLKEFLQLYVKKRDKKIYNLIVSLLERNHATGAFDITNINRLYKLEGELNNALFSEAVALFKEAFNATGTSHYIRVYKRTDMGGWQLLNLNFASI